MTRSEEVKRSYFRKRICTYDLSAGDEARLRRLAKSRRDPKLGGRESGLSKTVAEAVRLLLDVESGRVRIVQTRGAA